MPKRVMNSFIIVCFVEVKFPKSKKGPQSRNNRNPNLSPLRSVSVPDLLNLGTTFCHLSSSTFQFIHSSPGPKILQPPLLWRRHFPQTSPNSLHPSRFRAPLVLSGDIMTSILRISRICGMLSLLLGILLRLYHPLPSSSSFSYTKVNRIKAIDRGCISGRMFETEGDGRSFCCSNNQR